MRSIKQQLLLLVIGPLVLLSVIGTIITGVYMKDRAILATDTKAKSDLATGEEIINQMYPGPWQVRNGILYKGDTRITNNFVPVDKIASLTGDTVTIFLGDTRVSTTVRKKDGQRAIGTKVSHEVDNKVLRNGEVFLGEANVVGEIYRTAYKPIRDENGKIIGMFYVGISKKLSEELIDNSLFTMAAITIVVTLMVAIAAWYFAQKVIVQPLQEITRSTQQLATGRLENKVDISGSKEIDELATAFNQMVEGLQGLAGHIAKVTGNENTSAGPLTAMKEAHELFDTQPESQPKALSEVLPEELPKGLNDVTMKQILAYIGSRTEPMSAEEIGEGVNLTRVTARRYLEYLEQLGRVEVEQKYGTVGRPVKLYKNIS